MKHAIEILKAERGFNYYGESRGVKIASTFFLLFAFAATFLFACASVLEYDVYYLNFNLIICVIFWLLYLSTGVIEKNARINNLRYKMNKRNWLFYLPFTHHDFVRSVYVSWIEMYAFTCLCNAEYWAIVLVSGKEPLNTGLSGLTAVSVYIAGAIIGIYVITAQFSFGKVFKVITLIGRILGWIFYFFSLSLSFQFIETALEKIIPQGFLDMFRPFCSPFSLLGIVIVPVLVFGIMEILLVYDKKRSWTHN